MNNDEFPYFCVYGKLKSGKWVKLHILDRMRSKLTRAEALELQENAYKKCHYVEVVVQPFNHPKPKD